MALLLDFEEGAPVWMFRRCPTGETGVLSHRSDQQLWELPWAERLEKESYRDCLARELDWQLQLDRHKDFIVCSTPRISLIVSPRDMEVISREEAVSRGFGILEVYPIQLYGSTSRQKLAGRSDVVFMPESSLSAPEEQFTQQTSSILRKMGGQGFD